MMIIITRKHWSARAFTIVSKEKERESERERRVNQSSRGEKKKEARRRNLFRLENGDDGGENPTPQSRVLFSISRLSLSLSTSRRIDLRDGEYYSRMRSNPRKDGSLHTRETRERERERKRKEREKKIKQTHHENVGNLISDFLVVINQSARARPGGDERSHFWFIVF